MVEASVEELAGRLSAEERGRLADMLDPPPNWRVAWFKGEEHLHRLGLICRGEFHHAFPQDENLRKRELTDLGHQVAAYLKSKDSTNV